VHPAFYAVVRSPAVLDVLTRLLGPDLRLHSSKLNMKAARYGSPVEWHQDWAFYPHTNDDLLAIGVMLDDMDLDNGPLLVFRSHTGRSESSRRGRPLRGLIDPAEIDRDRQAVALTGPGSSRSTTCAQCTARRSTRRTQPQPAPLQRWRRPTPVAPG
jgi:hypothetical protein